MGTRRHIVPHLQHMFYGGDYNPEQWPEEIWPEDVRLMQEAGVNLVSIAIFAWVKLNPKPGVYELDWLQRIIDQLHAGGVAVNLATATASPPAWLAKLDPTSLAVNDQGVRYNVGGRQHYCPSSASYRTLASELVTQLAQRFGQHPAVVMWHINNEYTCHIQHCYCDVCVAKFRGWLQAKYQTLDNINEKWGTAFWSQTYTAWDEIQPPARVPTFRNPGQLLDWQRFSNDNVLELYRLERELIRSAGCTQPICTNFMGFHKTLDLFEWAEYHDVIGWDAYPDPATWLGNADWTAFTHDLMRSLKPQSPFILMEQVTSQVNWRSINVLKAPGQMRSLSLQAVARGGDAVMFFQWRQSRIGAEKYHGAMVPHVGADERSRVWREVKQLGADLKKLSPVAGTLVRPKMGMLTGWEQRWSAEMESKPFSPHVPNACAQIHRALWHANLPTNAVQPGSDLAGYRVLIAPMLYMITAQQAENLRHFVRGGGTLVMTYFSGIVDEFDRIGLGGYPALLRDVLGLRVEEWHPYMPGTGNEVLLADGKTRHACSEMSDLVQLDSARPLGEYTQGWIAGRAAITLNHFGSGRAYYLTTKFENDFLQPFLTQVAADAGVNPILATPDGVEASLREGDGRQYLFIVNHNAEPATVELAGYHGQDLLTDRQLAGRVSLDGFGVVALAMPCDTRG